ncbi:putative RNA-binding Zn-ribbon protein involved in translation (DUF1610 family) [Oikeobacillus pervagus]|uniref:RNA-binding Zn-ribbon protein involved in translation (DUF1610 family) n=1 Tax=Oikeobacillus pervagus TaxID=1325931 RepID=A0AAJ1SXU3_9BACI|nr:hypothetical protein [Oikeobacillus pervagus]MDQ0214735.1 putative RNA-binding Zn-ribbon protein involved in translation (DUF1610 family) [Oikeobacillus pervagus]
MGICLLCNGLNDIHIECHQCNEKMIDRGKIFDYFDDYNAYMDFRQMLLVDGDPESTRKNQCQHVFYCPMCEETQVYKVSMTKK